MQYNLLGGFKYFVQTVTNFLLTNLLKKRLWHRCFPANFSKFSRSPFLQSSCVQLLLFTETSLMQGLIMRFQLQDFCGNCFRKRWLFQTQQQNTINKYAEQKVHHFSIIFSKWDPLCHYTRLTKVCRKFPCKATIS